MYLRYVLLCYSHRFMCIIVLHALVYMYYYVTIIGLYVLLCYNYWFICIIVLQSLVYIYYCVALIGLYVLSCCTYRKAKNMGKIIKTIRIVIFHFPNCYYYYQLIMVLVLTRSDGHLLFLSGVFIV